MDLGNQASLVRRWWWVVVLCSLLLGAAGAAQQLTQPTQYASRVTLYMSSNRSENIPASQTSTIATQQILSYAKLVGTGKLAHEVAKDAKVDIPTTQLANGMTARVNKDTVLLDVTTTLSDKDKVTAISNQLPATMTRLAQDLGGNMANDDFKVTFTAVDGPKVGSTRSTPKLLMATLLGLLLGAALGLAIASLLTRVARGLRTPTELRDLTQSPVLGVLPSTQHPDLRRDALRRLATVLANPRAERRTITVLGVEASPTTTAEDLAEAFAAAGDNVLLVSPNGRSAELTGTRPVADEVDGLAVLPADALPATARQWREFGDDPITEGYDRIVIAGDNVTGQNDLASAVATDSTVLVARQFTDHRETVSRARSSLCAAGVAGLVAVLDEVDPRRIADRELDSGIVLTTSSPARPARASH